MAECVDIGINIRIAADCAGVRGITLFGTSRIGCFFNIGVSVFVRNRRIVNIDSAYLANVHQFSGIFRRNDLLNLVTQSRYDFNFAEITLGAGIDNQTVVDAVCDGSGSGDKIVSLCRFCDCTVRETADGAGEGCKLRNGTGCRCNNCKTYNCLFLLHHSVSLCQLQVCR